MTYRHEEVLDSASVKFINLFNESLKTENFNNKVSSLAKKEIFTNRQSTIVKAIIYIAGGFVLALLGGLAQKFLGIFNK